MIKLTEKQQNIVDDVRKFLNNPMESFMLISGFAGTGKTTTMMQVARLNEGRLLFTAPTNKATKVLAATINGSGLDKVEAECMTIFSALNLKLSPSGEVKKLTGPKKVPDLTRFSAVIIDEGSMVSSILWSYIEKAALKGAKFIIMGDSAQLPPVNEVSSPVWDLKVNHQLTDILRHDSDILNMVTQVRGKVGLPFPNFAEIKAPASQEVLELKEELFRAAIVRAATNGDFCKAGYAKVIAWRNDTVSIYNKIIRAVVFQGTTEPWVRGERVVFAAPLKSADSDEASASTDDEGTVNYAKLEEHPFYSDVMCYKLLIDVDDGGPVLAYVVAPEGEKAYEQQKARRLAAAKADPKLWMDFWHFVESFADIRYGYAITAHRSQGSTYQHVYVVKSDITVNRNKVEACKCLYVAMSRAAKTLTFC